MDKRNEIGNLGKIEKRERNRGRRIMKRMKEAWNDIYQNSAMSVQILRDNAARFRKGQLLLNFTKLRDGNDLEPEVTQIRVIEQVRIKEIINGNENNEEEIMKNINQEEDKDTRIMKLRFGKILHTLTEST